MANALDIKDEKILSILAENSKLTSQQISRKTAIPLTTVHNRIKKMEREGVIKKYSVVLDRNKIGKPICALILISVNYPHEHAKKFSQQDVARKIRSINGVDNVAIVTGGTDIVAKVCLESIEALNDFLTGKLRNIDGIDKTQTMVILGEY